jgi:2'-5' RNA ligase
MNDEPRQPFKRLFFALSCPPDLRRTITRWRSDLGVRNGRPVPGENLHLTLLFLGSVHVAQMADICTAAAKVRVPGNALRIVLDRLETWPRSAVMVLTPEEAPPELLRLVYALEQAMLPFGFQDLSREYRPHLTLMRDFRAPVPEATTTPEFFVRADRFVLYESHKGRYREVAAWPLV